MAGASKMHEGYAWEKTDNTENAGGRKRVQATTAKRMQRAVTNVGGRTLAALARAGSRRSAGRYFGGYENPSLSPSATSGEN
jgi:hypothetical protein